MTRSLRAAILGLTAAALSLGAVPLAPAFAADLPQLRDEPASDCAEPRVLGRIERNFRHQVTHVPHLPDVAILDFRGIHEQRGRPYTAGVSPVPRLYCGATVLLSDGRERPIWYMIEYGLGFASLGNNVEFCVSGFDRWNVYNGHCRVLR
ncbi:hypothetical protein N1F89_02095 [Aquibium sp. A9E412]|uniref:hypothetical protein n=1 Tax=Aquibium sp. A9E412 TaxID=2976767 RepID=UPI0025B1D076|nr:hypothetical protein [Aquibium sp. A9E412]MDN2564999.1 hypothetical protein [Aquibium sp. A9E412]